MGKSHLELRRADAIEHDEVMRLRKELIKDRVLTIMIILILDVGFIIASAAVLAGRHWVRSILPVSFTLILLFFTVILLKDREVKPKAIKNRDYMVSEGIVVDKANGGSYKHPRVYLTVENKDGSRGRYLVKPYVYGRAVCGVSCLVIKYDKEEYAPRRYTRDVVICKTD